MMLLEDDSNSEKVILENTSTNEKHKTPAVRVKKKGTLLELFQKIFFGFVVSASHFSFAKRIF